MNNRIIFLFVISCLSFSVLQAKNKGRIGIKYDIECAGTGETGTYLINISIYSTKPRVSTDDLKKGAVHGVIFRGFTGKNGCVSQKPIATTPALEEQKADFFDSFFGKGSYLKYATLLSNSYETVKLKKREYKIKATMSVSKEMLRKDLESAGVIKALTDGF